jgi:hypothetical protein
MLKTMYMAYNNIKNVMLIFLLFIFVFTVAGMDLFGELTEGASGEVNVHCNFSEFYLGFATLFRASTGESWNGIMHDYFEISKPMSITFWVIYQMMTFFIFMNVFIAVIYEEYDNVHEKDDATEVLSLKKTDI